MGSGLKLVLIHVFIISEVHTTTDGFNSNNIEERNIRTEKTRKTEREE
jgi:hypothetical protein